MRLVEPCCGSAALSMHLWQNTAALVPYQGNKWRLRREIAALLPGRITSYWLNDLGPWGATWQELLARRPLVLRALQRLAAMDPREAYDRIHGSPVVGGPSGAAAHLFLQRLAANGKAVAVKEGRWASPGFNPASAYGREGTERFGRVKPQLPTLLERVRTMTPPGVHARATHCDAREAVVGPGDVVYLDPPYAGTTRYVSADLTRPEVVALAQSMAEAGAYVIVSEREALDGGEAVQLRAPKNHDAAFRSKGGEWATIYKPGGAT